MKVITIKQPWATLIVEGYKEYEFRTWKTKYRGEILIHASKEVDKKSIDKFKHLNLQYPTGQIITKANIIDCIKVDDELINTLKKKDSAIYTGIIEKFFNNWNGYGFKLKNVEKIKPIKVNGKLGLWDYNYK